MPPEDLTVGYCTNVHAGIDLAAIRNNLDQYAVAVRDRLGEAEGAAEDSLGVGLWIPDQASRELVSGSAAQDFASFLSQRKLTAFTINGFPFDNFHQDVVKHNVYLPTWADAARLEYTQRLAEILSVILPESESVGSISTLPIGWPNNPKSDDPTESRDSIIQSAGKNLRQIAKYLEDLESRTGRRIVVAIEPEPGCILDTTDDMIALFTSELPDEKHRRYLTVCHDVCHAAVMMESQDDVINRLTDAGIAIGKVQVSSAIVADWESMADGRRREALQQLSAFAEDRYLHQTGRRKKDGSFELSQDLPELVIGSDSTDAVAVDDNRWVVHFHVPIFLERFGHLSTSHDDVLRCLRTLIGANASKEAVAAFTGHLEIETYAWTVLPEAMRKRALPDDIAGEIQWLQKAIVMCG